MGINRGKQFEDKLKEQFEKLPDTLCLRLYDVTTGFKNQNNPCDFIVFRDGTLNLFEVKAVHGNTLNFKSHIRENQWYKLQKYSVLPAVNAGIIVWFIDKDFTLYLPIGLLHELKLEDFKSFNINDYIDDTLPPVYEHPIEILGTKKKVFFEYDLKTFLDEISY